MKTEELKGKTALVTGASRGIGKAISLALATAGVNLLATARTPGSLKKLMDETDSLEGDCSWFATDLVEPASANKLIQATTERFGRLDILVNNAGILPEKSIAETSLEDWDRVMAVNARAPFLLSRAVCPLMKSVGGGTIIQVVSVVGEKSYVNQGAYTASKHALMGFSKALAQEVQPDNIRVHTILPGGVDTEMSEQINPQATSSELMAPSDIADIVMFLLTHRSNAVIDAVRIRRSVKDPWF